LVYFNVGFGEVYQQMSLNTPAKLSLTLPAGLLFATAGSLMGIGEVFMDNTFWQRAYAIRRDVVVKTFMLSGIGWILVPLAVASLAFVALGFGEEPAQINQVAPMIAQIYGGPVAGYLFLVAVWSALCSTTAASINALATLIMNDAIPRVKDDVTDAELMKFGKYLTIVVGVLGFLLSLPRLLTMLNMLIFLGVINIAFVFPIIAGLWWEKANPHVVFVAAVTATVLGYAAYFQIGSLQGVAVSGWLSFIITFGGSTIWPGSFEWGKLQRVGEDITEVAE
jgi:Na+/proline symporter